VGKCTDRITLNAIVSALAGQSPPELGRVIHLTSRVQVGLLHCRPPVKNLQPLEGIR
jgi:hypothetical protein